MYKNLCGLGHKTFWVSCMTNVTFIKLIYIVKNLCALGHKTFWVSWLYDIYVFLLIYTNLGVLLINPMQKARHGFNFFFFRMGSIVIFTGNRLEVVQTTWLYCQLHAGQGILFIRKKKKNSLLNAPFTLCGLSKMEYKDSYCETHVQSTECI